MSSFTAPLQFSSTDRWQSGRRVVRITKAFRYYVGAEGSSLWVDVPKGFETDLGSIPRMFRGWISPDSPFSSCFALHDFTYREALISRWMCDLILLESSGIPQWAEINGRMGQVVMPPQQRLAIYSAVRAGGWAPYGRYAAEKANHAS